MYKIIIIIGIVVVVFILIGCFAKDADCHGCLGSCPGCGSYDYKKDKNWPNGNVRKWCMKCGHKWWA